MSGSRVSLEKMRQRLSHVFLTVVWTKMASNLIEIPLIFLANAMKIPRVELVQNPCHVSACKTNKTWIHGIVMEFVVDFDRTAVDL